MNKREILTGLYKEFKILREKVINIEDKKEHEIALAARDGFLYAISLIEDDFKKE